MTKLTDAKAAELRALCEEKRLDNHYTWMAPGRALRRFLLR